jgi:5-methylcytosine-specific restriction endonuclease McrA
VAPIQLIGVKVKRLNPKTGSLFKSGDIREDGFVFDQYRKSHVKENGFYFEVWRNPEQYKKVKSYRYLDDRNKKSRRNAITAKRSAARLKRTPPWLNKNQLEQIKQFYQEAKELETSTGIKHHVDHIVPLQGENVSGLHVPWNLQVLTAAENCSKNNSF